MADINYQITDILIDEGKINKVGEINPSDYKGAEKRFLYW